MASSNMVTTIELPCDGPKDVEMAEGELIPHSAPAVLIDVGMVALELRDEDAELDYDIEVENGASAEDIEMGALDLCGDEGIEMGDGELDEDKDMGVGELNDDDMEIGGPGW